MINILLVEDHIILQDSLAQALGGEKDMTVLAGIEDADDAPELAARLKPDLILMDVVTGKEERNLPLGGMAKKANGISAARKIRQDCPAVKIIIITSFPEIRFIRDAKEAGVQGFVYKNVRTEALVSAIHAVMAGFTTFPDAPLFNLPITGAFSEAELAVLGLVCKARSRKEIAAEIGVSEATIKARIRDILAKTGFDSILKFAVYAVQNGFIVP